MHLKDDELVDLAERARPEASAPHLASCEQCRRQVRDLRDMMAVAAEVDVPEPSPLYWDHLSARVRESVAAEASPRRPWLDVAAWRRVLMPASAAAVAFIVIVVALSSRLMAPPPPSTPAPAPAAVFLKDTDVVDVWNDAAADDDESLTLMASLSAGLDLEAAGEAGLAAGGSAEHAVTHMDDADLRELKRLLTQELAPSGD
jgi:anti-sigma-K factor RskA